MPNAALSPFDRETLTPSEMVKAFHIIRASVLVDELSAFPRHENISVAHDRVFFNANDLPKAVIFVSHRWNSPTHPDPDGEQFAAVRYFLTATRRICDPAFAAGRRSLFQFLAGKTRESATTAVLAHGGFQAAYLLGSYNPFDPKSGVRSGLLDLGRDVLNEIGVWYDYTSMPQDPATHGQLLAALERIHELIGASNFVALREPGDAYDERAWCAAEVSTEPDIERSSIRRICIRLDKIGQPFPADVLLDQPPQWKQIGEITIDQLRRARSSIDVVNAVASFIRMVGVDAEDERDFPLFFVKRKPWLFKGQREFLVRVMDVLIQASALDQTRASNMSSFSIGLDVAAAATKAAKSVGLVSSNEEDIPYTVLLILYARHRGAPALARLFAEALQRYLRGATTVLARYRETRMLNDTKCWFHFEDEAWELALDSTSEDRAEGQITNRTVGLPAGEERDEVLWNVPAGAADIPPGNYAGYVEWGVAPGLNPARAAIMVRAILYLPDPAGQRSLDVTDLVKSVPLTFTFK